MYLHILVVVKCASYCNDFTFPKPFTFPLTFTSTACRGQSDEKAGFNCQHIKKRFLNFVSELLKLLSLIKTKQFSRKTLLCHDIGRNWRQHLNFFHKIGAFQTIFIPRNSDKEWRKKFLWRSQRRSARKFFKA
jgi:hypothetical protein